MNRVAADSDERLFLRIVEGGSLKAAAAQLGVDPSAVSRRLSALEQRLGLQLLERATRGSVPTELGARYYEGLAAIVAQEDALEASLSGGDEPTGHLRVSAPPEFGVRFVVPVLEALEQRHAGLSVELSLGTGFADLGAADLDAAVRIGTLTDSSLRLRGIGSVPRPLVAAPRYLQGCDPPTSLEDLEGHAFLGYLSRRGSFPIAVVSEGAARRQIRVRARFTVNSISTLVRLVEAGRGLFHGPLWAMEEALDPSCGILIAWKQNGRLLETDHGYPVRLVIPGYIGGRMIKWLCDISVTAEESNNFFHYNDNRVLPPPVSVERAGAEGWWFKPEYIINQLNINGAISRPNHGDKMTITDEMCTINGYAYTGGGREIIRCEMSLDGGMTWMLANVSTEEIPRMGRYWCWFLWEIVLPKKDVAAANELLFRAFDAAQNSMPERPTWNVMGMMNNPWYRVRIHHLSETEIAFEHPTQAGPNPGGWMVKMAEAAGGHLNWGWGGEGNPAWKRPAGLVSYDDVFPSVVKVPELAPVATEGKRLITWDEIAKHTKEDDVWIVVGGKVYDATSYLKGHHHDQCCN